MSGESLHSENVTPSESVISSELKTSTESSSSNNNVQLTDFDEEVLTRVMRTTQAWELLQNPQHCGSLSMGELYDLMLKAGYSEETASEAAKQRGLERLDAGVKM